MTDLSSLSDEELLAMYRGGAGPQADYATFARQEAQRVGLNPDLVTRVMAKESAGNPGAVSPKGARGLMQLMPGTAADLGVNPDDPYDNIRGGVRYLKQQMDEFGDERLALAAYNAGPGAVKRYGGVPPYAETQEYVSTLAGQDDLSALSDEELLAMYQGSAPATEWQEVARTDGSGVTAEVERPKPPPIGGPALAPKQQLRADQGLGLQKGILKPLDNGAAGLEWLAATVGLDKPINALGEMLGLSSTQEVEAERQAAVAAAAREGRRPGAIGEFAGNVLGTLPLGALKGGVMLQGALGGAALTDAKDAEGVIRDAAVGAVAGKVADEALKGVGKALSAALSKSPKVMDFAALEAAKKAAYAKVDEAGFRFNKADAQALAGDVEALIRTRGGPKAAKLYADADAFAARLKAMASQKGGVPLTQLDELRGDIFEALVKPGGKEAVVGKAIREKIDGLISKASNESALIREARELNTRFAKARTVMNRLESADLARGRAYTGKNTDNTIRQKLSPLIDPMHGARLRNATPDEAKALKNAVTGTKAQNAVRTLGTLLDPRGVIGMGLQATGAAKSGGLSLASVPLGLASTAASGRMAQKNVEELLRLIAVGGSKEALKKQATPASRAAGKAVAKVRPAAGLIGASAATRVRAGSEATREKNPTRSR